MSINMVTGSAHRYKIVLSINPVLMMMPKRVLHVDVKLAKMNNFVRNAGRD